MKDYLRVAKRIEKMGTFSDIHNCGFTNSHCPVNLYFELSEPGVKGYKFYVAYDFGKWSIDYTLDASIVKRVDMCHIGGIRTDRDMYAKVEEIINLMRNHANNLKQIQ